MHESVQKAALTAPNVVEAISCELKCILIQVRKDMRDPVLLEG